jgi:hypothetical protein
MLIGFCGAGGTGKTVTSNEIIKARPDFTFHGSVTRGVYAKFGYTEATISQMSDEQKLDMQMQIIQAKYELDESIKDTNAIVDRTPIDALVYTMLYSPKIPRDVLNKIEKSVTSQLKFYDLIVYFPIGDWVTPDDGFRNQDEATRRLVDAAALGLLEKFDADYIKVGKNSSPEARAQLILTTIE